MPPVATKYSFAGKKLAYIKWSTTASPLNNFGRSPEKNLLNYEFHLYIIASGSGKYNATNEMIRNFSSINAI
jgi:hypothetical protein